MKHKFIKKQMLIALLSFMLCGITALSVSLGINGFSTHAFAVENDEVADEEAGEESGEDTGEEPGEEEIPAEEPEITPEPPKESGECICISQCKKGEIDEECEVCKLSFRNCEWIDPKVVINIENPKDWKTKATKIKVEVIDEANSGHFELKSVEARIGSNGSYSDITEDMQVTISENCTLYIQATEMNGKVTTESRKFTCFDTDKPTVNAGIEGELLYVEADDATSGVAAIYVNGNKFTELTNDKLTINLNDYSSVYEYVTILALDRAGNRSGTYKIKNPYYVDPEKQKNKEDASKNNPESIQPSKPTSSTATVTSHTDLNGNTTNKLGGKEKEEELEEETVKEAALPRNNKGKEFYTIKTDSEKTFYLVIDKEQSNENVYLLTEVNENDLLNFVNFEGQKVTQGELPLYTVDPAKEVEVEDVVEEVTEPVVEKKEKKNSNSMVAVVIFAAIAGAAIYFMKKKGNKSEFEYEEEDATDIEEFEAGEEVSFAEETVEDTDE